MNLHILAASDRNNYGDLLFPLVVKKIVEINKVPFDIIFNYGIISSDLSKVGALETLPLDQLLKNVMPEDFIIIAGGEVLGNNWFNIYRYINKRVSNLYKLKFLREVIIRSNILNYYFLRKYKSSYPFLFDGLNSNNIIYNCVGGSNISKHLKTSNRIRKYFKTVKHLSIRDHLTQDSFNEFSITNDLAPDSAILMSDLFQDELEANVSKTISENSQNDYVFVQLGNTKGPDNLALFAKNLSEFANKFKLRVILSPIGIALDHDDSIILRKLQSFNASFEFIYPESIFDTMYLLKNAQMYIGTSLHGVVTSQSFGVPFVAFPEKILKLHYFIQTWFNDNRNLSLKFSDFHKVYEVYENHNKKDALVLLENHKKMVYRNFSKMFNHEC